MDNYINKKFGRWKIIGGKSRNKHGAVIYLCQCECAFEKSVKLSSLKDGSSTQCRACSYKNRFDRSIIGKKFNHYKVLDDAGTTSGGAAHLLKCQCDCGRIQNVAKVALVGNKCKQCRRCAVTKSNKRRARHGMYKSSTYNIWRSMKGRCKYTYKKSYNRYGGRGISVCNRWLKFDNFLEDMGKRPEGMQLDRVDNDGNYEPGNCRWVTPKVNANNRKTSKK